MHEHQPPTPPPLPDPKYLEFSDFCKIEYVDVDPAEKSSLNNGQSVAIVMVHGAPGSFRDFRYLIPTLAAQLPVRIVGINLPGYLGSIVEKTHYLDSVVALRAAQIALDTIRQICGHCDIFLVGHSFGANAVVNIATLNLPPALDNDKSIDPNVQSADKSMEPVNMLRIRGVALLAPAGCSPPRMVRLKIPIKLLVKLLRSGNPVVFRATTRVVKQIYVKVLGFPRRTPASSCVSAIIRVGTTDFSVVRKQVIRLKEAQTPVFVAWALDDSLVEPEIPEEVGRLSSVGPRLEFAGGGHNIQKTRVEQISGALASWVSAVLSGCSSSELGMIQHLS